MQNQPTNPITPSQWRLLLADMTVAARGLGHRDPEELASAVTLRMLEPSSATASRDGVAELLERVRVGDDVELTLEGEEAAASFTVLEAQAGKRRLRGARGRVFEIRDGAACVLAPCSGGAGKIVVSMRAALRPPAERLTHDELRNFAFRSLKNKFISDWRAAQVRARHVLVSRSQVTERGPKAERAAGCTHPDDRIDASSMLDKLHPGHARVLELTVVEGLTGSEAAEELGVQPGTIQSRAFRARVAARQLLAGGDVTITVGARLLEPAQLELRLTRDGT
jgi:DNA-directed RNA polymerase specialized sigma24 family protein/antitoxin (DNA-binding transcriptional repressor) of toxin-antitoxin stability system